MVRVLPLLLFSLVTAGGAAAQCKDAVSTKDMQDCADAEYKKADAELNSVYQATLKKLKPDDGALLRKAQRAWLVYRDAHCDAQYHLFAGGSIAAVSLTQCRATLAAFRAKEIKDSYTPQAQ
jgi:uncharacterized protein YecT (DUF1311 family)